METVWVSIVVSVRWTIQAAGCAKCSCCSGWPWGVGGQGTRNSVNGNHLTLPGNSICWTWSTHPTFSNFSFFFCFFFKLTAPPEWLKGNWTEDASWRREMKKDLNIFICLHYLGVPSVFIFICLHRLAVPSVFIQLFFALNLSSSWWIRIGLLFSNGVQKRVGLWCTLYSCHTCRPCLWRHR